MRRTYPTTVSFYLDWKAVAFYKVLYIPEILSHSNVNRMVNVTTLQIARMFKAKRVGEGKWRAVCPVHGGRHSGPLSIDQKQGTTVIKCFGGCDTKDVLLAVGLGFSDLFPESKIDYSALQLAREVEMKRISDGVHIRRMRLQAWKMRDWWGSQAIKYAALLATTPESDQLAKGFHNAIEMQRKCDAIGTSLL